MVQTEYKKLDGGSRQTFNQYASTEEVHLVSL